MSVNAAVRATVTNVGQGGRWVVIQEITTRLGPFDTKAEADKAADLVTGFTRKDPS